MTADSDGNIMEKQEKRTETDTPWTPNGHPVDTKTDTKADRQKGAERGCRGCRRDCL